MENGGSLALPDSTPAAFQVYKGWGFFGRGWMLGELQSLLGLGCAWGVCGGCCWHRGNLAQENTKGSFVGC